MHQNQKILAIIPARSGSKGMKDKNIALLQGKPLLGHTIEAALQSGVFTDIVVSTDSQKYADIAQELGASVPSLRPAELSTDSANSIDFMIYTLELLEKQCKIYDYIALLQPTSPLRTAKHIQDAVDRIKNHKVDSVISVCPCDHPVEWTFKQSQLHDLSVFGRAVAGIPRQSIEPSYRLNGAIFLCNVPTFRKTTSFYGGTSMGFVMDTASSIDIDSLEDFQLAEYLMAKRQV